MTRALPAEASPRAFTESDPVSMTHDPSKAPSVLIVIGHPVRRRQWSDVLARQGYSVGIFEDGEGALAELGNRRFDLVIADIFMRGMDGLELLRLLPETAPGLPVIVIGAPESRFNETYLRCAELLGAAYTYNQSPDPEILLECVRRLIHNYGACRKGRP